MDFPDCHALFGHLLRTAGLRWLIGVGAPATIVYKRCGIVYNTIVKIVIDTNVLLAALRSKRGASHRLLSLVGTGRFDIALSVPLVLEYEDVTLRYIVGLGLSNQDVDDILDYLCAVAIHQPIYYLWRPLLPDPKDDMLLEVAVAAACQIIVTFNGKDFVGSEAFGIRAIAPKEFLQLSGDLP